MPWSPVFTAYRRLFATPGALAFTCYGLIGRLSFSMLGVSLLTAIADRRHSYALAGTVAAAGLVGVALGMPLLGRLVDRYGQRRVTVPAALASAVPRASLPLLLHLGAPAWTLCAAALGASVAPNLGGMARARWAHLHRADPALLHRANALEQALDELCYLTGPVLGMLLCTTLFPEAGLLAVSLLSATGALLFATQRRTEPPLAPPPATGARSPLRIRGVLLLVAVFLGTGVVFGSLEITTLAWSAAHGRQSAAGLLLGLLAAGSGVSGLLFGLLPQAAAPVRRLLLSLAALAALLLLPLSVAVLGGGTGGGIGLLAAALFVAGTGTAPTMVSGLTLLQRLLPAATLNEGMAFAVSGIVTGISAGSALGGLLAQHERPGLGYLLPAGAAALALLVALAGAHRLRPERAGAGAGGRGRAGTGVGSGAAAGSGSRPAAGPENQLPPSAPGPTLPAWRARSATCAATPPARRPRGRR
ncbi:MFS transporter [Kitasatospora sp. NBC_01287]|uniref:MFS transporter n=1 Tax=Kitasatospora sp. NBC_01287 TaxID=2903573 RepID=UPI002254333E|nr:MFS transporter [Kitasatospora sp. NBC_01287]MCX4748210.1 MFS transporter [Kitasatospora sp. NBC_01287]